MVDNKQDSSEYASPEAVMEEQVLPQGELIIGTLVSINSNGMPQVSFDLAGTAVTALDAEATISIYPAHIGRQVAIMFMQADMKKPVVIGLVHNPLFAVIESEAEASNQNLAIEVDGEPRESVSIEGKEEVVLRCGDASITLTKEGKILLRGKYLVSRSSGVNRILGGSVQVN